jgi:hypothetical protein
VHGVAVSASFDGGKTWQPQTVSADGNHWMVNVTSPAGAQ